METNDSKKLKEYELKQEIVIAELKSKLEKELIALLAHPLVPEEFKAVFEEN